MSKPIEIIYLCDSSDDEEVDHSGLGGSHPANPPPFQDEALKAAIRASLNDVQFIEIKKGMPKKRPASKVVTSDKPVKKEVSTHT